jgi:hypothetical protein
MPTDRIGDPGSLKVSPCRWIARAAARAPRRLEREYEAVALALHHHAAGPPWRW